MSFLRKLGVLSHKLFPTILSKAIASIVAVLIVAAAILTPILLNNRTEPITTPNTTETSQEKEPSDDKTPDKAENNDEKQNNQLETEKPATDTPNKNNQTNTPNSTTDTTQTDNTPTNTTTNPTDNGDNNTQTNTEDNRSCGGVTVSQALSQGVNEFGYSNMLANAPYQSLTDPFGYYNRVIHSLIAWKIFQTYGFYMCGWGLANSWAAKATTNGISVGHEPKIGAVAVVNLSPVWVEAIDIENNKLYVYGAENSAGGYTYIPLRSPSIYIYFDTAGN